MNSWQCHQHQALPCRYRVLCRRRWAPHQPLALGSAGHQLGVLGTGKTPQHHTSHSTCWVPGTGDCTGHGSPIPVSQCSPCKISACLPLLKPFPGLLLGHPAPGWWAGKATQTPGCAPLPIPTPIPPQGRQRLPGMTPGPCEWQWHAAVFPCPWGQGGCWHRGRGCPGRSCSGHGRGRGSLGRGGCSPWRAAGRVQPSPRFSLPALLLLRTVLAPL